jgi:large exoprotein involved in heme utilization and adhesion
VKQRNREAATGNAGDIDIALTGDLTMQGYSAIGLGGGITSDTQHVGELVDANGMPRGRGGNISLSAHSLEMSGSSHISSTTSGVADSGDIAIDLSGHLSLTADASPLPPTIATNAAASPSEPARVGGSGSIAISVISQEPGEGYIRVSGHPDSPNRASISSNTFAGESSGSISLHATGPVELDHSLVLSKVADDPAPGSQSGSVEVRSQSSVSLRDSLLSSGSDGVGIAGNTVVSGTDVLLERADVDSGAFGTASAGGVEIAASGQLTLRDSSVSTFSSATESGGEGGSITLSSGPSAELLLEHSTLISTSFTASGGNITINAAGSPLTVRDSLVVASAKAGGNGGNVTINEAGRSIIQRSQVLADAEAGNGGNITISIVNGEVFVQDSQSILGADSQRGINGQISVSAPDTDLNTALKPQDVDASRPPELATNACAPSRGIERSTFVREGRGGVGEQPDGYLGSAPAEHSSTADKAAPRARAATPGGVLVAGATSTCR